MARISGPLDTTIPSVAIQGVPILVPVDLPEGGFLQVVVGPNPLVPARPSVPIPKGAMVAIIPPEVAEHMRAGLNQMDARIKNPLPGGPPA
jgi:hypothetical protein